MTKSKIKRVLSSDWPPERKILAYIARLGLTSDEVNNAYTVKPAAKNPVFKNLLG